MVLYEAPCNYQVVGILLRSPYIENDQRQAVFSRLSFQKLLDLWEFAIQIIIQSCTYRIGTLCEKFPPL